MTRVVWNTSSPQDTAFERRGGRPVMSLIEGTGSNTTKLFLLRLKQTKLSVVALGPLSEKPRKSLI
jgi:hypothetical protein